MEQRFAWTPENKGWSEKQRIISTGMCTIQTGGFCRDIGIIPENFKQNLQVVEIIGSISEHHSIPISNVLCKVPQTHRRDRKTPVTEQAHRLEYPRHGDGFLAVLLVCVSRIFSRKCNYFLLKKCN